jgi:5-methylcytosine-specific restriction endonuclease McrA
VSSYDPQIAQARRIVEVAQSHLRSLLLLAVCEQQGTDCAYCRVPTVTRPAPGERHRERTLDHIVPLSRGGTDTLSNVCCCCRSCNARKQARPVREYAVMR